MSDLTIEHLKRVTDLCEEKSARIAALEAQLAEAREIFKFVSLEDMQIMENGYKAEEMADDWLSKYPEATK